MIQVSEVYFCQELVNYRSFGCNSPPQITRIALILVLWISKIHSIYYTDFRQHATRVLSAEQV